MGTVPSTLDHRKEFTVMSSSAMRKNPAMDQKLVDLACFSPLRVAGHYAQGNKDTVYKLPFAEQFLAAVLFVDMSGFTPLSEKLSSKGMLGVEELSTHLNSYFSKLVNIVYMHGGDVVKFAGDAVLVMWGSNSSNVDSCTNEEQLSQLLIRCIQCSIEILKEVDGFSPSPGLLLKIRCAIGCGLIYGLYVGGTQGKREFLIKGDPIDQIRIATGVAKKSQVIISGAAYSLVSEDIKATSVESGCFLIHSLIPDHEIDVCSLSVEDSIGMVRSVSTLKSHLRSFIPNSILPRLDSGMVTLLAELRTFSIIFILLPEHEFNGDVNSEEFAVSLENFQNVVLVIQEACFSAGGIVRQLMTDDKGTVMILAFGVSSKLHCAPQAVRAALKILSNVKALGETVSIGITTGNTFCGIVGNSTRCEFGLVGDKVNTSARLMCTIDKKIGGVMCDHDTYLQADEMFDFEILPPVSLKGKSNSVAVYSPSFPSLDSSKYHFHASASSQDISQDSSLALKVSKLKKNSHPMIGRSEEIAVIERQLIKMRNLALHSHFEYNIPGNEVLTHESSLNQVNLRAYNLSPTNDNMQSQVSPIVIEGVEGSGKSYLLSAALEKARNMGSFVFVSTAEETEQFSLYFAFRSIIPSLLCALATVLTKLDDFNIISNDLLASNSSFLIHKKSFGLANSKFKHEKKISISEPDSMESDNKGLFNEYSDTARVSPLSNIHMTHARRSSMVPRRTSHDKPNLDVASSSILSLAPLISSKNLFSGLNSDSQTPPVFSSTLHVPRRHSHNSNSDEFYNSLTDVKENNAKNYFNFKGKPNLKINPPDSVSPLPNSVSSLHFRKLTSLSPVLPLVVACKRLFYENVLHKNLSRLLPLLNDVQGILNFPKNEEVNSIQGESRQCMIEHLIVELFLLLTRHTNNLLIIIDDMQFLDSASESLLGVLMLKIRSLQVMFARIPVQKNILRSPLAPSIVHNDSIIFPITPSKLLENRKSSVKLFPVSPIGVQIKKNHAEIVASSSILSKKLVLDTTVSFLESAYPHTIYIRLGVFTVSQMSLQLCCILGSASIENRLLWFIYEKCFGNPFYAEQVVIALKNAKAIELLLYDSLKNATVNLVPNDSEFNSTILRDAKSGALSPTTSVNTRIRAATTSFNTTSSINSTSRPIPFGSPASFSGETRRGKLISPVLNDVDDVDAFGDYSNSDIKQETAQMIPVTDLPLIFTAISDNNNSHKNFKGSKVCVLKTKYFLEPASLRIPESFSQIMSMRLDRLSPSLQMIVKVASVIGVVFTVEIITAIYPLRDQSGLDRLALNCLELCETEFFVSDGQDGTFHFRHVAIKDIAYNRLPFSFRCSLHKAIASWYMSHEAEESQNYSLIASHWLASSASISDESQKLESLRQCVHYLVKAGEHASFRGAHKEVINLLSKALSIMDSNSLGDEYQQLEFRSRYLYGASLVCLNGYDDIEVASNSEQLLILAENIQDDSFIVKALVCSFMSILSFSEANTKKLLLLNVFARKLKIILHQTKNDLSCFEFECNRILAIQHLFFGNYLAVINLLPSLLNYNSKYDQTIITDFQPEISVRCILAVASSRCGLIEQSLETIESALLLSQRLFPFSVAYVCQKALSILSLFELPSSMTIFLENGFEDCDKQGSSDFVRSYFNIFQVFQKILVATNLDQLNALAASVDPSLIIEFRQPSMFLVGCRIFELCRRYQDGKLLVDSWKKMITDGVIDLDLVSECYRFSGVFIIMEANVSSSRELYKDAFSSLIVSVALGYRMHADFLLLRSYNSICTLLCMGVLEECSINDKEISSPILDFIDQIFVQARDLLRSDSYIKLRNKLDSLSWDKFENDCCGVEETSLAAIKFAKISKNNASLNDYLSLYLPRLIDLYGLFDSITLDIPDFHVSQKLCEKHMNLAPS